MRKLAGGFLFVLMFVVVVVVACKSAKDQGKTAAAEEKKKEVEAPKPIPVPEKKLDFSAGPPTIVYRTRGDYRRNVAVTLSADKSKIVSFPGVNDVYYNSLLAYPYNLRGDYLLDNRGIDTNVAFLKMNYETYSKLPAEPKAEELYEQIIDKHPLLEMYNCGNRKQFRNDISEINQMIADSTLFQKCKKMK
jgi:hypothetical protein